MEGRETEKGKVRQRERGSGGMEGSVYREEAAALPYPPVCQLVLLVCLHTTAVLQEKGQGVLGKVENATGLTGIKQVYYIESKVSLEPLNIPLCSMHHLRGQRSEVLLRYTGKGKLDPLNHE